MKKRILIPTDFSENSINAIRYAVKLYGETDCEFHIMHSYYLAGDSKDSLLIPKPDEKAYEKLQVASEVHLDKVKAEVSKLGERPGHKFFFSSVQGPLMEILTNKVKKDGMSLIVMGTRGQNDEENLAFGSVAVSVMENVRECPVLAIPRNVDYQKPNEIVFPTGFNTRYKLDELDYLAEMARLTGAPVRILYISKGDMLTDAQVEKKNLVESKLAGVEFTHHNLYDIPVKAGVRCFVQSRESEMIAFVNKKHFFFGSVFSDPLVKQIGRYANVPLLGMHDVRD